MTWNKLATFLLSTWLVLGMGIGCSGEQVKPTATVQPAARPELEFRGIGFKKQSFLGTDVVFKFALSSKDDRPAKSAGCSYKLELREGDTLEGKIALDGDLPARGELPVQVRLSLPWPTDREQVVAFLQRKRLPYQFSLTCEVDAGQGPLTVSNTDSGSIPLPKLPQLDVLQANAERFGQGEDARINFELNMANENPFSVRLDKVVYKVFLEDTQVTKGDLVLAEIIPPSNAFEYDIRTPMFNKQEHKAIMELLNRSQVTYRLEGVIHLGEFQLPIQSSGTISFPRAQAE
jgi:LEA14-like dessication related protein